ncbi:MAG: histone [Candidatus Aenigmatarchaeota archaeon]
MEMTLQSMRRLFKKAGAKRVSDKAAIELGKIVETKASSMLLEAKKVSEHSGRRTILKRDVKLAKKILEE